MGIQIIPQSGGLSAQLGSALGQGIGKGLSEHIPQEIDRYRLSKAFKNLKGVPEGFRDIFLANPKAAATMLPFLQNQQEREAWKSKQEMAAEESKKIPQEASTVATTDLLPESTEVKTPRAYEDPSTITRFKQTLQQEPTFKDIEQITGKYLESFPNMSVGEARAAAEKEINQNLQAQRTRISTTEKLLNDRLSKSLQSGGLGDYKDISGEIQNRLVDQAIYDQEKNKMTPEVAAEKAERAAFEMARAMTQMKKFGGYSMIGGAGAKSIITGLREQQKVFQKNGLPDRVFMEAASAGTGLTQPTVAHILDPIKNQELSSSIKKIKRNVAGGFRDLKEKEADDLIKKIKNTDNLMSIAYDLREKGIDVADFAQKLQNSDYYKYLNEEQKYQLQTGMNSNFYGDLLFRAFGGAR